MCNFAALEAIFPHGQKICAFMCGEQGIVRLFNLDSVFSQVRYYAAPESILALMEVFGPLCTMTKAIIGLFAGSLAMQFYNIYLIWTHVRASDDLRCTIPLRSAPLFQACLPSFMPYDFSRSFNSDDLFLTSSGLQFFTML